MASSTLLPSPGLLPLCSRLSRRTDQSHMLSRETRQRRKEKNDLSRSMRRVEKMGSVFLFVIYGHTVRVPQQGHDDTVAFSDGPDEANKPK